MDLMSLIHEAGFRGSAAQTMYGIVMAESGGSATAHNNNASTGDDSYGLAQINMLGGMGPERRKQFGLSSNADLFDPLTNLKVAYALSGGGKNFSPWTTYTSGAYKSYSGGSGAQVESNGETPLTGPSAAPGKADYSAVDGLKNVLNQVPELRAILNKAIATGMSTADFQDAIESTDWWKKNSATTRQFLILRANDKASYDQQLLAARSQIRERATQLGVKLSRDQEITIARTGMFSNMLGDQGWVDKNLIQQGAVAGGTSGQSGLMAQTIAQIQQAAAAYGFKASDQDFVAAAQKILSGHTTMDHYLNLYKTTAKSRYPGLSSQIDAGMTVKDLAQPYISDMSQLLEIDPDSIDLNNGLIRRALQGSAGQSAGKGSTTPTQVPLWQFEQQVRSDPRWQYTQNAHQDVSNLALQIGKDWGFI